MKAQKDSLQVTYDDYVESYRVLCNDINQRNGHTNISDFILPMHQEVSSIVNSVTGGWNDTSDFGEFWTDVKALYMWVRSNIDYRSDGLAPIMPYDPEYGVTYKTEMWQFPTETLELQEGDCEDQAILLCSMIRCYSENRLNTDCIWITGSESAHAGVQVPVSDHKLVILDPAGNYYSNDFLGNIVFNDISLEINNWLDYWTPSIGSDVQVYRVFFDIRDEIFASTNEYINWMYS